MTKTDTRGIDSGLFRSALGKYASGITVITGRGDDGPTGSHVSRSTACPSTRRWSRSAS